MSHEKSNARPRSKKAKKRRYQDEDAALSEHAHRDAHRDAYDGEGSSSEEEIVLVHESNRQKVKRRVKEVVQHARAQPKTRTICWRWFLFIVVACLGVAMIIQLYSSYGEFITDQIFPPRVSSAGLVCGNGTTAKDYMLEFHKYEVTDNTTAGWLHLNATQPQDSLQYAWTVPQPDAGPRAEHGGIPPRHPQLVEARWKDNECLLVWLPTKNDCASVVVISV